MSTQWGSSTNADGSKNIGATFGKPPLTGNGFVSGYKDLQPGWSKPTGSNYNAIGGGLNLNCPKGHGIGVSGQHIPSFGNQVTGSAKLNILQTENHRMDANAFATKSFPKNPAIPSFNTHGASADYQYKNKIGASVGMADTPMFQKRDYSAAGSLNLAKTQNSSLDLNMGATKSVTPYSNSGWQPGVSLGFKKTF